jgi:predicted porin
MKKSHIFAGALALLGVGAAQAQTSVQIYGLVDTAVEYVTNVNAAGNGLARMPNLSGGMFPSRFGFRGTEDLGDGLSAIFTLENGFAPDSGTLGQGNRLFGRQAWVGLNSSKWGALTFGRTYSMLFLSYYDVDLIGPAVIGISNLDLYLPNARHDNSISYKGVFSGLTVGATYSFGRDASSAGGPASTSCPGEVAGDSRACRNWSSMLRYDGAGWGVLAAYDTYNGGTGAAAPFSPTSSSLSDSRWNVGGYGVWGPLKIGGGWTHRKNEGNALTPISDMPYLGASYNLTPALVLTGEAARLNVKNSPNDSTMYIARLSYNLSKRTAVYGIVGHMANSGTAAVALSAGGTAVPGGSQNGVLTGIMHSF